MAFQVVHAVIPVLQRLVVLRFLLLSLQTEKLRRPAESPDSARVYLLVWVLGVHLLLKLELTILLGESVRDCLGTLAMLLLGQASVCVRPQVGQKISFLSEGFFAVSLSANKGPLSSLKR